MDAQPWMDGPPRRLLLATDLSPRCDRALDRAVQLARQWHAKLVALTVVERGQMPDQVLSWLAEEDDESRARLARGMLHRELRRLDMEAMVEVSQGEVVGAVRERAHALDCPLIVTGMARDEPFGRLLAGSTAESLAGSASPLLLVTRQRVHGRYHKVLIATDFSDASRHALLAALRLFPDTEVVLYHAYTAPFSGLVADSAELAGAREVHRKEMPAFLAATPLTAQERARVRAVVEFGPLEPMMARYIRDHDLPLVLIGVKQRPGFIDFLLGKSVTKLLQWVPCDTLLVREPQGA